MYKSDADIQAAEFYSALKDSLGFFFFCYIWVLVFACLFVFYFASFCLLVVVVAVLFCFFNFVGVYWRVDTAS